MAGAAWVSLIFQWFLPSAAFLPISNNLQFQPPKPDKIMPRKRFIVPWTGSDVKPALYHCISHIVDKRFALSREDKNA
jgi:hypothetical protein